MFSIQRIVIATGEQPMDLLKTICHQGGVPITKSDEAGSARTGDVWLCPVDDRLVVEDGLQGHVLAFTSEGYMCNFIMPYLLEKAAKARDYATGKSKRTVLREVSIMVQDRGGKCGPERQIEGTIQALQNDEIAILGYWDKSTSVEPSWLWFDRLTGKCTGRTYACMSVNPEELAVLTTAPPSASR